VGSNVVYIGLRGPQPDHGHGGPNVVGVHRNGQRSNLVVRGGLTSDAEFEWGYEGAGPRRLAQAILDDFLGFDVEPIAASAFMAEVVARLPAEFELTGDRIASWVNDRLVLGCLPSRSGEPR
jgi:hypothetical protein